MRHTYEKQIMVVDIVVGGVTVQDLDVFDFLLIFRVVSAVDLILVRCWGRRYDRAHDSVLAVHRGSRVDPVKLDKKFQMASMTDDRRASVRYIYIHIAGDHVDSGAQWGLSLGNNLLGNGFSTRARMTASSGSHRGKLRDHGPEISD
jgi:hypothetical protein